MHCNVTSSGKSQYPCSLNMSADARGVLRGHCKACPCNGYSGGPAGLKCVKCSHPPGKHEKLSTSGSTPTSSSASDQDVAGQQIPLQSSPKPSSQPQAVLPGLKSSPPMPTSSFVIGPQLCQVPGCTAEADFDLNTSIQHKLCQEHRKNLPHGLQSSYVTDNDEYGETLPGSSPTTDQVQPLPAGLFDTPSLQLPLPSRGHRARLRMQDGHCSPAHEGQSSIPPKFKLFAALKSARRIPHEDQTSTGPAPPSLLGSRSTPTLAPQTMPSPPVPLHLQCKLSGCTKQVYQDHEFCGRSHAMEYKQRQEKGGIVPAELKCKTPGCTRQRCRRDDGNGHYDYCGQTCRDKGQSGLQPSASAPSFGQSDDDTCALPGCTKRKYLDPANGRQHDFCGRTHAAQAQKSGIIVQAVSLRVANAQEFSAVSAKFTTMWVKGTCPKVSFIFVITNTNLEQRWGKYKRTLKDQRVEEHYHGTMLTCNITGDKNMCSDQSCGVCGISRMGLDQRCIQKNINFQRFGHGFYLAPNSSKCHDYTQGANNYRAMLLCDVVPGNKFIIKNNDQKLTGPPPGFDSVYGKSGTDSVLNYDEIVVYNPDCAMPRFVIVYQKDRTHKIAK